MAYKKYVIWIKGNRIGEFEFCPSTQQNYCRSLEEATHQVIDRDTDWFDGEDEGYDVEDKDYIIYEIKLRKIMNGAQARSKAPSA
ncbi:MAG: hypothetical protein NUV80_06565 [Candidatus Berkelbacteria bacterium]|nr:hypothetical protein [Candidatus Berkelbacteria bacterium]